MKKLIIIIFLLIIFVGLFIFINKTVENKKYNAYNAKFTSLVNQNKPEEVDLAKVQKQLSDYLKSSSDNKLKGKALYNYRCEFFKTLKTMDGKFVLMAESSEQNLNNLNKDLSSIGIKAKTSEGMIYFVENNDFSIQKFAPYLGKDWKDFYLIRKSENNELFDDGSLVITKEELRRRITAWEDFLNKYPNFPENNEIKAKLNCYISTYLRSQYDFSADDNKISPESIKSFNTFLEQNKDSKFSSIVKRWNDLLKENNYKYSDKLEKFSYKSPYEVKSYNKDIFDGFSP